jgi:Flp pilus assembly protein TadD
LDFKPDCVDAHVALGRVLVAQGELEKALSHFLEAVRLDPRSDTARYRLAQTYRKLGRTQEADREREAFQQLRESQAPLRALYQQIQQRSASSQAVEDPERTP